MLFVEPVSPPASTDRGLPVDRFYVERFLEMWAEDVRGRVLAVGDASDATRFGGGRVDRIDVLDPRTTAGGSSSSDVLAAAATLPDGAFDCVLLPQALHRTFDVQAAARTLRRLLTPGGVLLLTVPGISAVSGDASGSTTQWSFTRHSVGRLFAPVFGQHHVEVAQYGNALTATACLQGLAADELSWRTLTAVDERFPVTVTVRAVRPVAGA
jgi:SAM-dependent methyltransferase